MELRDRVTELRRVPASELLADPRNWRTHPKAQHDALKGVLEEVGFADAVLARELDDGSLMLIDGHLRAETAGDEVIPVLIIDVTEEEAGKLLATLDPMAAMADADSEKLRELLLSIKTNSQPLQALLEKTADQAGLRSLLKDEIPGDVVGNSDEVLPESGVRMVQLFFNSSTILEFSKFTQGLEKEYGTDNITDTTLEALSRAYASLQRKS
jgi:hypothetical protein